MTFAIPLLMAVISLTGLTGSRIKVNAAFDANNVRRGDPMLLNLDFVGVADFSTLHPPALSRQVDRKIWKVDDESAKTDTYNNARRLTYRVRPLVEGMLEFPALEFTYMLANGATSEVIRTVPIPVNVRSGSQVALVDTEGIDCDMPAVDGLHFKVSQALDDDAAFAWRKAMAEPSAAAFAEFDFPEARYNEATMLLLAGNWAKALKLYARLEWQVGQTIEIERGIAAALTLRAGAPAGLPVWRELGRPLLRYDWRGRALILVGTLLLLGLGGFALNRLLRALAMVLLLLLPTGIVNGEDIFTEMERQMEAMRRQLHASSSISFGGRMDDFKEPTITATIALKQNEYRCGERFELIMAIEMPKSVRLSERLSMVPSSSCRYALKFPDGNTSELSDGKPTNPSNVVKRFSIPMRYDAPLETELRFSVQGMYTESRRERGGFYSFSRNFAVATPSLPLKILPFDEIDKPDDFMGAVGTGFAYSLQSSSLRVHTNDVVVINNKLTYEGFVPEGCFADELDRREGCVLYRTYAIADGRKTLPGESCVYYDTDKKAYLRAKAPDLKLEYLRDEGEALSEEKLAVNVADESLHPLKCLRLSPSREALIIGSTAAMRADLTITETIGDWLRVDDGKCAGWVLKENLK